MHKALKLAPSLASKVPMIAAAVLEECDARDGLRDGLISDPRRCRFNPRILQCPGGDGPDCLTLGEVRALLKIYGGAVNSDQEQIYPGLSYGHEDGANGWPRWVTGSGTTPPVLFPISDEYLRSFIFGRPGTGRPDGRLPERHRSGFVPVQGERRQTPHVERLGRSCGHACSHGSILPRHGLYSR